MVDDQHIDAPAPRMGDRPVAGGAAIEGDDEARAGVDQLVHGRDIGAVALEDAVGNMDLRLDAEMAQVAGHQAQEQAPSTS